jgi:triosephosphate isomerase
MKKLIAGNWKMNGLKEDAITLARDIAQALDVQSFDADLLVCPPFVHIDIVKKLLPDTVSVGGQDCSAHDNGAYTGETSAAMLKDVGCSYVILGHSERRDYQAESNTLIAEKAAKAHEKGLIAIICVGEKESEREEGREYDVVGEQLDQSIPASATAKNLVIAYEPVWAIGTGKVATPDNVRDMHKFIREKLQERLDNFSDIRILYGGSVKPDNARTLFSLENVDGALIGGASLKASDFLGIAEKA